MDSICFTITFAAIICIKILHLEITKLHICWFDNISILNLIS